MAFQSELANQAFLFARIAFTIPLLYLVLPHFLNLSEVAEYAGAKGVPWPKLGTLSSGILLSFGTIGILLGAFPILSALCVIVFLVMVTPVMHDFWAVPEEEVANEQTNFMKNVALLGAAFVLLALGTESWQYALGISFF